MSADTAELLERLIEVRRYGAALELLRPAFRNNPNDADLHCFAARASLGLERLDEAEQHVMQALATQPRHYMARVLWFALKRSRKQHREAEQAILDLLREQPENAYLLALYADLMLTNLQLDKARALAAEALRREPMNLRAQVVNVLVRIVEGDDRGAKQLLARLVTDAPDELQVVRTLYLVLVTKRRFREALEVGKQLLHFAPDNRELIDALVELRAATHWTTVPLYPLTRWGWPASAALWLFGVVGMQLVAKQLGEQVAGMFAIGLLGYVVYSWVYPPLLKRWLRWRGI